MNKVKTFLAVLICGILLTGINPQNSNSQNSSKKIKTEKPKFNTGKKISKSDILKKINKNTKSFKKDSRGTWLLQEDFETGSFPPLGWTVTSGGQEWEQASYSGYGTGIYSMRYSSWNCNYTDNTIYTPTFSPTVSGDKLIFDHAYAPYNDGSFDYYDNLEIFYYDDNSSTWFSLTLINGIDLQTAPGTGNYYEPLSNEWGTKEISIPSGATQIYFQVYENCSNNLYIDNIRVGIPVVSGNWVLQEDFELGNVPPSGWSADGTWNAYNVSGYGIGDYSAIFEFSSNPPNDALTTDYFTPSIGEDTLIFDIAYTAWDNGGNDTTSFTDAMTLYYSTDDGSTFNYLVYLSTDSMKTAPSVGSYFVPEAGQWKTMRFVLPTGTNRIQFGPENGWGNNLFIDNVIVSSSTNIGGNEASVEKVWAKGKLPLVYGVPDKISALIKNNSGLAMINLKVYLNITGTSLLADSLVIPSLGAGDTMQVDFNGFTPVLNGFSTVTISLPDDDVNGNNSKDFLTEANTNTIRYVDSNCCNSSVGYLGEASFLNKYTMSGSGQIRKVNIKISGSGNVGQIVYGIVLNSSGQIVGKSPHYKIKASDEGNYKSFDISDPKPFIVNNDFYYVGIAQTEYSGDGFAFTPQEFLSNGTARPDANYGSGLSTIGTIVGTYEFSREWGFDFAIGAEIGNQAAIDAGVSDLGLTYDQYFSTTSYSPVGRVFNAGTGSATFTVNRKITPGGYTSTKTVTALTAGGNTNITFDPWTFTSGTIYTIRDSVILSGDGNISNNVMSSNITPRIAKQVCVLWSQQDDRDSLVRAINTDGRFANNFDTVRMNYTGSYRPWKYMFANLRHQANYSPWVRDSLKAYLDNSTPGNKKSLIIFGNVIAFNNDPNLSFPGAADSIFYRQYLKSSSISDNWPSTVSNSNSKFRGIGFFGGISQDSLSDPDTPELIKPVNGGTAALKPMSVTGNGSDSCNAVSFAGANYNTFFMTNKFSSLRSTYESPLDGPVLVYTKIMDWLLNTGTSAKVLNINILPEGLYDVNTNTITRDTIRVYLRNATSPFAKVDSGKVNLSSSGQGTILFNNAANGVNYYIQVVHRNSMETWSGTPQMFTSNSLSYDFTDASNKAYGDNMKFVGSNWVIYAGDAIDFGTIDVTDLSLIETDASNSESGYINSDLNNDLFVDVSDVALVESNATQGVFLISPLTFVTSVPEQENILDYLKKENNIDHEIYERFKNSQKKNNRISDLVIIENGKAQKIINGRNK